MATRRDDCIDQIASRTGRTRKDVEDELDELLRRQETHQTGGESPRDALGRATYEMLEEHGERAASARRQAIENMAKFASARRGVDKAPKPWLGIEALLAGVNRVFEGHRDSIENRGLTLASQLQNEFSNALERLGLDRLFSSRTMEKDWGRELFELSRGKFGSPGATKNKQAMDIANAIHDWQKVSIQKLNAAGAWIKSYSGYVTRTSHDPDKIRKALDPSGTGLGGTDADRAAWVSFVLPKLDLGRTFGTKDVAVAGKILTDMWASLKNGDHYEFTGAEDEPVYSNIAKRASAHRELNFRDYDTWAAYNERFGITDPTRTVVNAFDTAARRTALLERLGTKPRENFENLIGYYKNFLKNSNDRQAFERRESYLRNLYNQIDHSENKPGNEMLANITEGWSTWQRMAKLNRVLMTHIAGLTTVPTALRQVGVPFGERFSAVFTNLFRGMEDSDKRKVADLMLEGSSAVQQQLASRFDKPGALGKMAALENVRFRLTGTSSLLERQRSGAERIIAKHFGGERDKAFADLGDYEKNILKGYGLGEPEWNVLKTSEWTKFDESPTYLTPDIPRRLSDDAMRDYLDAKRSISEKTLGPLTDTQLAAGRERLVQQLHGLFYDQGRFAMYEPSARVRARLYGSTQQTMPNLYQALRLFWQFRVWPAEMIMRTWGREVFGAQTGLQKVAGVTELLVGSAIFGAFAEGLREVVQGQDPTQRFATHPWKYLLRGMVRSGAGTILGDYLFGEFDRHNHSILASLAGPTFSQIEDVNSLKNDIVKGFTEGKWGAAGAETLRLVRQNTPIMDMWWTGRAMDYLVWYRLQEWLNPGYLSRMEKRMRDKQGIQFWLSPQKVAG